MSGVERRLLDLEQRAKVRNEPFDPVLASLNRTFDRLDATLSHGLMVVSGLAIGNLIIVLAGLVVIIVYAATQ